MVLDISPLFGPQRWDCEELIHHTACSNSAVATVLLPAVAAVVNCACCALGGTGQISLFLLIQGMLEISPGCLGAIFLQLSWKTICVFWYSLSPIAGSGVAQSTTKEGSSCMESIRDQPRSWKSLRFPLAQQKLSF